MVELTNQDKIFWAEDNYTKGDLLDYYEVVAPYMLYHLKDRALMLHRFPNGIEGLGFFQKNAPKNIPDWVNTVSINDSTGKVMKFIVANDIDTLLYVANLGTIDIHPFLSRNSNLYCPDFVVLDLDPEDISFNSVLEVACVAIEFLKSLRVPCFCKTSGKRGLHLYIPLGGNYSYKIAQEFAKVLALCIHNLIPEKTSILREPKKRQKKVYIDFLQNGFGKTVVAPYAVRALKGAPVACPVSQQEIENGFNPIDFTIKTVPERLKSKKDLFKGVMGKGVEISKIIMKLDKRTIDP